MQPCALCASLILMCFSLACSGGGRKVAPLTIYQYLSDDRQVVAEPALIFISMECSEWTYPSPSFVIREYEFRGEQICAIFGYMHTI
ncbi:secreted protein [gut metagenome]|uniref:Secreted protein n=1 Tax=gut metagenome TaxID=749906 RepID=J9GQ19_9ZZZZ